MVGEVAHLMPPPRGGAAEGVLPCMVELLDIRIPMVIMAIGKKRRGKVDTFRLREFLSIIPGPPSSCPTIV
jgi:hypothetical protein